MTPPSLLTALLALTPLAAQPAATKLPPLDWMQPGTRITYYDSKGTMTTFADDLEPDEHGEWIHKRTRQRYRSTSIATAQGGAGGYGFRQHDVVAVEDGTLAVDVKSFSFRPDLDAAVQTPGGQGLLGTLEKSPSLHVHPRVLAAALAEAEANPPPRGALASTYRTTVKLGDRTYDAVRIVNRGAGGHVQQTYDLASGLLLLESSVTSTKGSTDPDLVHGKDERRWDGRGETIVTWVSLVSVRRLELPAASLRAPLAAAFGAGPQLLWQGGYRMIVPGAEHLPVPPSPIAFAVRVVQAGRSYSLVELHDVTNPGLPVPAGTRVLGPASLGAGWLVAPAYLRGLRPQQVLDRDATTRSELVFTGQGADGLAWIVDRGAQHEFAYGYDPRSGVCQRIVTTLRPMAMVYDVTLGTAR